MESYTASDTRSASAEAIAARDTEAMLERIEAAKQGYADARSNVAEWRKEAMMCDAYVAGHQWNAEDMKKMEDEKRPPITFNRVGPYVDAVVGTEINNREEVRTNPREPGDVQGSGVLDDVIQFFRDESNAEHEESTSFRDCTIRGVGCSSTWIDYTEDPDGLVREDRVDSLQMAWPSSTCNRNLSDAPEVYRTWIISKAKAREMFPDWDGKFETSALGFGIGDYHREQLEREKSGDRYAMPGNDSRPPGSHEVMLVERQYWETEPYYRVAFPGSDRIVDIGQDAFSDEVREEVEAAGGRIMEFHRRRYYRCFYTGNEEVEHEPLKPGHPGFTYKFVTGRYDATKGYFYGMVRPLIDPQNWGNKLFSNILHVMNTNAKGGVMYERGAFVDKATAEKKWADPSGMIEVEEDALKGGKIQERKPAEYPAGLDKLLQFTLAQPALVTGASPEFMGQAGINQPGVLEAQRKQSSLAIFAWLFDAMKEFRKEKTRLLVFYIQNYIPEGRLVRVVSKGQAKYVPMVLNKEMSRFDIVLENSPTTPNRKAHTFATLMQMLPMLVKAGVPIPKEVFTYSDLPNTLAQSFADGLEQARKPDPRRQQMEEQALLADLREKFAKIAKDESQAEYNRARAEATVASIDAELEDLTTNRMKVVAEIQRPRDVNMN